MKSKRVVKAKVQSVVRRFTHVTHFNDDTDFIEVRANKKRPTSWVVSKSGVRKRSILQLSECLRFVEMGHWNEIKEKNACLGR